MCFSDCRASPNRFSKQTGRECKHSAQLISKICWVLNSYKLSIFHKLTADGGAGHMKHGGLLHMSHAIAQNVGLTGNNNCDCCTNMPLTYADGST